MSTPLMQQYNKIKEEHQDDLLLFHLGDFYELFHNDAIIASKVLGITLTSRTKGENAIPMAGVPCHAATNYIQKLIRHGYRVAICEQVEPASEAVGIVERAVTRVITPGTILEESLLHEERNNYLLAFYPHKNIVGISWIDVSTGAFYIHEVNAHALADEVARIVPSEILHPVGIENIFSQYKVDEQYCGSTTKRETWEFDYSNAYTVLCDHFGTNSLTGFGCEELPHAISAAGALLKYLMETQKNQLQYIQKVMRYENDKYIPIDRTTQNALELIETYNEKKVKGSLLEVLDNTCTAQGARLLRNWILSPLKKKSEIDYRLDCVEAFSKETQTLHDIRDTLDKVNDMERLSVRIACARANARDLRGLGTTTAVLPEIKSLLGKISYATCTSLHTELDVLEDICELISKAIIDEPPHTIKEGGIIREGYSAELDGVKKIASEAKQWLAEFQNRESKRTGIPNLRIGFNRVFGYYIEITNAHKGKAPDEYVRKQTLKNAERYITAELTEHESKVTKAESIAIQMEYEIFDAIRNQIANEITRLQKTAEVIALLDVLSTFAYNALNYKYIRPIVDENIGIEIVEGRHPVLERRTTKKEFVPNDVSFTEHETMHIITGPNMAGKSTFIRQVALITLMAQLGSFVPATSARIGLVDRIFTRVGAGDNIAQGQSTFMVEMAEVAHIVNNATSRSLIILDEIGRGTSTYDGVSLAWAIAEYIHARIGSRTLFATHYHEITALSQEFEGISNYSVSVKEWKGQIIFLYKIKKGSTDKSYGIHVGKIAGLPHVILNKASRMLDSLQKENSHYSHTSLFNNMDDEAQLTLFTPELDNNTEVVGEIESINVDKITPIDALQLIQQLQIKISQNKKSDTT